MSRPPHPRARCPPPPPTGSYNQIMLKSPVLLESELDAVRNDSALNAKTFSLHYTAGTPHAMADALTELCKQVRHAQRRVVSVVGAGSGWGPCVLGLGVGGQRVVAVALHGDEGAAQACGRAASRGMGGPGSSCHEQRASSADQLPTALDHRFPMHHTNLVSPPPPALAPRWRPLCALGAAWSCCPTRVPCRSCLPPSRPCWPPALCITT